MQSYQKFGHIIQILSKYWIVTLLVYFSTLLMYFSTLRLYFSNIAGSVFLHFADAFVLHCNALLVYFSYISGVFLLCS